MNTLHEYGIVRASNALIEKEISSVELTQAYLDEAQSLNPALNAYIEIFEERALSEAKKSDIRRDEGKSFGVLDGVPIAIKDNMLLAGELATAGSHILHGHIAARDATVCEKLKSQGAVFLGRTNMDEFAMGSSTERSYYGPTKNSHDIERVPGGSSGGSAVAVAANFCAGALGTDTGGSIRQPASFCGIVGLKPTYGRVSRSGIIAMASSLDQVGPMTKNVEDAAILFSAISGSDDLDQTTVQAKAFHPAWKKDLHGVRIGLPRVAWGDGMSEDVRRALNTAIEKLKILGAEIVDVDLPYADEALAVYYVLMPCEVSANLSRFDGMRFGRREPGLDLNQTYIRSRSEGFGVEARRRILLGTFALSRGYYDAYYVQAKKVQTLIRRGYEMAFQNVDALLTPTTPTSAFKIGEKISDPLSMYLEDIFTVGVNVAGLPAVSIPVQDIVGMPIGMQFIGKHFDEAGILSIARVYEESERIYGSY